VNGKNWSKYQAWERSQELQKFVGIPEENHLEDMHRWEVNTEKYLTEMGQESVC